MKSCKPIHFEFLALSLIFALFIFLSYQHFFLCDDAYISFRYAKNLVLGNGLVWNQGERVEGYTNFLWVILISVGMLLGADPQWLAPLMGFLATMSCFALTYLIALHSTRNRWIALLAIFLLAINRSWLVWTWGGLETRAFTFLILLAYYLWFLHDRILAGSVFMGLATLTRPDGYLLFALMAVIYLLISLKKRPKGNLAKLLLSTGLQISIPFLLIAGSHFIFRLMYYGQLLPNTYYAKVGEPWPELGIHFIKAFTLEYGLHFIIPIMLIVLFFQKRAAILRAYRVALVLIIAHAGYYCYKVGGDHFEYRVFDFYLPFLAIFLAEGTERIWHISVPAQNTIRYSILSILSAWLLLLYTFIPFWQIFLPMQSQIGHSGVPASAELFSYKHVPFLKSNLKNWIKSQEKLQYHQAAIRMESHRFFWQLRMQQYQSFEGIDLPSDAITESGGIGVLGYFLNIAVIDRLGLTDATVAHSSYLAETRMIAHNHRAPPGYLESRGVNIWFLCAQKSSNRTPPCQSNFGKRFPQKAAYMAQRNKINFIYQTTDPKWAAKVLPSSIRLPDSIQITP